MKVFKNFRFQIDYSFKLVINSLASPSFFPMLSTNIRGNIREKLWNWWIFRLIIKMNNFSRIGILLMSFFEDFWKPLARPGVSVRIFQKHTEKWENYLKGLCTFSRFLPELHREIVGNVNIKVNFQRFKQISIKYLSGFCGLLARPHDPCELYEVYLIFLSFFTCLEFSRAGG